MVELIGGSELSYKQKFVVAAAQGFGIDDITRELEGRGITQGVVAQAKANMSNQPSPWSGEIKSERFLLELDAVISKRFTVVQDGLKTAYSHGEGDGEFSLPEGINPKNAITDLSILLEWCKEHGARGKQIEDNMGALKAMLNLEYERSRGRVAG